MDTLLFLLAIFAIAFVMIRFIVEDSRLKNGAVPTANAARTSLLQQRGWRK